MKLPELTDDVVIELAREGGIAFIPGLRTQRTLVMAQLGSSQRQHLAETLQQSLPLGVAPGLPGSPGRGDQRFFRIEIIRTRHSGAQDTDLILLVPEERAPQSLVDLWRRGEEYLCD